MARIEGDKYYTPDWMTKVLLKYHSIDPTKFEKVNGIYTRKKYEIFDPCAGDHAIGRVLEEKLGRKVIHNDPDEKAADQDYNYDMTSHEHWEQMVNNHEIGWVITNPPWTPSICEPIVEFANSVAKIGVAMLLRLSYLEPTKTRGRWLSECPPTALIVMPRFSFRGRGSDTMTAAWFIWRTDKKDQTPTSIVIADKDAKEL